MDKGKIVTILILATVLSVIAALIITRLYRARMQALMKIPLNRVPYGGPATTSPTRGAAPDVPTQPVSLSDNQRARRQLMVAFVGLTLLMALTRTLLMQVVADGPITWTTVLTLGAAYAWPVVPVIAVIDRWPRLRLVGVLLMWFVMAVALLSWRTDESVSFRQILMWMSFDIGLPLIVVTALCLGGATRAVGPWLMPVFMLLRWASSAGLDFLAELVAQQNPLIYRLTEWLSATTVMALFALAPWVLAWWPSRLLGQWIAVAYTRRQISELFYLFTAVWVIALTGPWLGALGNPSGTAWVYFLPLLWIPLGAWRMRAWTWRHAAVRPPTLLVLRVFQQDANVQALFDQVIGRWRLTGNTVLIAGTDLLVRTIDPDDIFAFLDGDLDERFIYHSDDVQRRLAHFEWRPDAEGRYRVNECYCHDTTWQLALAELMRSSDVVLMDLRNFVAANHGCLYELQTLSNAPYLQRVVVLVNEHTELAAAKAATATAPTGRFVWLSQQGNTATPTDLVLAPLFGLEADSTTRLELGQHQSTPI